MAKADGKVIDLAEWSLSQFAKHLNGYQSAEIESIRNITIHEVRLLQQKKSKSLSAKLTFFNNVSNQKRLFLKRT